MSAFDSHLVTVQPRKVHRTPHGTELVPDGPPIRKVKCGFRETGSSEQLSAGEVPSSDARILAREWPGDARSLVTHRGVEYSTVGRPKRRDGSPRTAHIEVLLKETNADG
ncbi:MULTISPECIES: hypothetical protein [unclassified Pseudoclavibacter]|uniref:hypothetical protein n=1 Tax=unclassified Pseudoclavibacter TaxID=2615177 RepID=UPI001BA6EB47|nr:hypothetical protein [Pseudoclavibacter sp. Marseille-Q4354]MBS3177750.1 hypothetical protein [Pseudoclavibacter sp. Marseille-Q4354]